MINVFIIIIIIIIIVIVIVIVIVILLFLPVFICCIKKAIKIKYQKKND